jgi:hypothetical protein
MASTKADRDILGEILQSIATARPVEEFGAVSRVKLFDERERALRVKDSFHI